MLLCLIVIFCSPRQLKYRTARSRTKTFKSAQMLGFPKRRRRSPESRGLPKALCLPYPKGVSSNLWIFNFNGYGNLRCLKRWDLWIKFVQVKTWFMWMIKTFLFHKQKILSVFEILMGSFLNLFTTNRSVWVLGFNFNLYPNFRNYCANFL